MTTLLPMLDRFEQAAVTYETSEDRADRDELHAARRAILEHYHALECRFDLELDAYAKDSDMYELRSRAEAAEARLSALVEREAELVALLSSARNELEYQHGSFEPGDIRCACCRLMRSIDRALHPKPKSEGK